MELTGKRWEGVGPSSLPPSSLQGKEQTRWLELPTPVCLRGACWPSVPWPSDHMLARPRAAPSTSLHLGTEFPTQARRTEGPTTSGIPFPGGWLETPGSPLQPAPTQKPGPGIGAHCCQGPKKGRWSQARLLKAGSPMFQPKLCRLLAVQPSASYQHLGPQFP